LELLRLACVFFKIGALTFGGGYAMVPLLMRETVERRAWITSEEFADITAIGQVTPGIIAVNFATFVGYKRRGIIGGICATAGMILPGLTAVTIIAAFLRGFADNVYVAHAFAGIRAVVCVLVFKAVWTIGKTALKNITSVIIFLLVISVMLIFDIPAVFTALAAAAFGVLKTLLSHKHNDSV